MKKLDEIKARIYTNMAANQMRNFENMQQEQQKLKNEQLHQRDDNVSQINNTIANIIKVIGWLIIVVGFIAGIVLSQNTSIYDEKSYNASTMLITWGASFLSAIMLFALAEIIQILHDIRAKVYKR